MVPPRASSGHCPVLVTPRQGCCGRRELSSVRSAFLVLPVLPPVPSSAPPNPSPGGGATAQDPRLFSSSLPLVPVGQGGPPWVGGQVLGHRLGPFPFIFAQFLLDGKVLSLTDLQVSVLGAPGVSHPGPIWEDMTGCEGGGLSG